MLIHIIFWLIVAGADDGSQVPSVSPSASDSAIVAVIIGGDGQEKDATLMKQQREAENVTVHWIPSDWNVKGSWTIMPLIPTLLHIHPGASWYLFGQDHTRIEWRHLMQLTASFDAEQVQLF